MIPWYRVRTLQYRAPCLGMFDCRLWKAKTMRMDIYTVPRDRAGPYQYHLWVIRSFLRPVAVRSCDKFDHPVD